MHPTCVARCSGSSARTTPSRPPDEVNQLEQILKDLGKTYEFHTYEGAGHAFFSTDRTSYRPEAAMDGWQRVFDWFGRYLSG